MVALSGFSCTAQTACLTDKQLVTESWAEVDILQSLAVSPDNKNLYIASRGYRAGDSDSALYYYDRNPETGALTNRVELVDTTNLDRITDVKVSPDGKNVYVVAGKSETIVWWTRDANTGSLSNKKVYHDLVRCNISFFIVLALECNALIFVYFYVLYFCRGGTSMAPMQWLSPQMETTCT